MNTKKVYYLFLIIPVFLAVSVFFRPVFAVEQNKGIFNEVKVAPEIETIKERGKLIVGLYYQDRPPFFMTDKQDKLYGLDIELARDIAIKLGVGVEFDREAKTFQHLFEKVAQGKVDVVISKFSATFDRAQVVRFTEPYVTLRKALMVNAKFAFKNNIKDYPMEYLRNNSVKVGVVAGTSWEEYTHQLFPEAVIINYQTWNNVISALQKGEIDATLYDDNEIAISLGKNSDIALFALVYILEDQKDFIAMALPHESIQFRDWLNLYLKYKDIYLEQDDLKSMFPEVYK
jgi:polar amino acid transport system substrate-binding protein